MHREHEDVNNDNEEGGKVSENVIMVVTSVMNDLLVTEKPKKQML